MLDGRPMTVRSETIAQPPRRAAHAQPRGDLGHRRAGCCAIIWAITGRCWRWASLCMIVSAAMTGLLAGLINPAIKRIFLLKHADQFLIIPLEYMAVIMVRAMASFGEQSLTNTIAERMSADIQRDMFRSQIRLDLGGAERRPFRRT